MQKSSLVALIMGTVSGVLFALGMCMCLVWEQIVWGTLIGLLGIIMLIALIPMIKGINGTELFAKRITGVLLVVLSFCIVGVTILSALKERGTAFHEIVMITYFYQNNDSDCRYGKNKTIHFTSSKDT